MKSRTWTGVVALVAALAASATAGDGEDLAKVLAGLEAAEPRAALGRRLDADPIRTLAGLPRAGVRGPRLGASLRSDSGRNLMAYPGLSVS